MAINEIPATSKVILETDSSKQFLDRFIGTGWDTWGQGLGGTSGAELMLQLFAAFNLVALGAISALFIWVLAVSIAGTAHEGTAFGKKYSSLWMPLRFVGAMGALAPIFKGLSLFQIALLACIGFSINMGNYVWEMGVDYFVEHGGQLTVQAPNQNISEFSIIANGTLRSLTQQYYLAEHRGGNIVPGVTEKYQKNSFSDGGTFKYTFNGNMGTITINCIDESDSLCLGKRKAIGTAISSLSKTAQILADSKSPKNSIDTLALYNAANAINQTILNEVKNYAKQGQLSEKLKDFQNLSNQYGWFMAGSSYWSISWINQEVREAMYSGISYSGREITLSEVFANMYGYADYAAMRERLANFIKTGYADKRGISATTRNPTVVDEDRAPEMFGKLVREFINHLSVGVILPQTAEMLIASDPIMALANVGDYFITSAYVLFTALLNIDLVSSVIKAIPFIGRSAGSIDKYITFLLFSVFIPFLLYGITLAYYLPAIPFIRWISAIAGWIILIVESLIAAPLWLCAHALPEGEGAAGQHGKRGYLLFLAILIRPPLMVAGFFSAVLLMNIMGKLIGESFQLFIAGVGQTKVLGPTGTISMIVILGIVIIMLANKFFSLIHYLPEHVTNWIGQQFHSLGEKEDQASVKGAFVSSTTAINSGGSGMKELMKKDKTNPPISEKNLA